jgi:hypothetical protein
MRFWAPWLLVLGRLLTATAAGAAVPVPDGFPPSQTVTYDVWREGSKVGTHSVEFRREGDRLIVHTRIRIKLKLLFVTVYRFDHDAVEDWVDGKLIRYVARTDDNGARRNVLLVRVGQELQGNCNAERLLLPGDMIPGSLWNPATIDQKQLIEPTKGQARAVRIFDRGLERVKSGSRTVPTRHYSITGDLVREVWYGPDGEVVQAVYVAKDDTLLTFRLQGAVVAASSRPTGTTRP